MLGPLTVPLLDVTGLTLLQCVIALTKASPPAEDLAHFHDRIEENIVCNIGCSNVNTANPWLAAVQNNQTLSYMRRLVLH